MKTSLSPQFVELYQNFIALNYKFYQFKYGQTAEGKQRLEIYNRIVKTINELCEKKITNWGGLCCLCNIMTLFLKPHKWCELLIFLQLVWCALGIVGVEYFKPQTEVRWRLVTYGYPILLLPIQFFACCQFHFLYKARKPENEKFLYLAISQVVSMVMLSLLWTMGGYVFIWAQAA